MNPTPVVRYHPPIRPGEPLLTHISIILPAKNEADGLRKTLPALRGVVPGAELIVVDDGSTDATAQVATEHGATVRGAPYSMGNGGFFSMLRKDAPGKTATIISRRKPVATLTPVRRGVASARHVPRWRLIDRLRQKTNQPATRGSRRSDLYDEA